MSGMARVGAPAAVAPYMRPASRRIDSIQVMRGVAALLVLLVHALDVVHRQGTRLSGTGLLPSEGRFGNFGAVGLDLFFVISGFVMAFSVSEKEGPAAARDFLVLRWIRIAPPYLVATVPLLIYELARGLYGGWHSLFNWIFFVPLVDTVRYTVPPLDIGWTLSFEFTFYLMVGLMVWIGLAGRMQLLGGALVALSVIGAVARPSPFLLQWITNPIFLEFAFGILAYELWRRGLHQRYRSVARALGIVGLLVFAVEVLGPGYGSVADLDYTLDGSRSLERSLVWGLPMALVFFGAITAGPPRETFLWRWGLAVGDRSYSLYLVHLSVFVAIGELLQQVSFTLPAIGVLVVSIAVAIAAAWMFFRWFERPVTSALRARYAARGAAPQRS